MNATRIKTLIVLFVFLVLAVSGAVAHFIARLAPEKPVRGHPNVALVFTDKQDNRVLRDALEPLPNAGKLTFHNGRNWHYAYEFVGHSPRGDIYVIELVTPEQSDIAIPVIFSGKPVLLVDSEYEKVQMKPLSNRVTRGTH